ncbi:MAG: pteridine reductase [Gammaproteobacteria bacterium]|nr:pteridine reductase [Gammaproteobacteria bacterium]
MTEIDKSPNGKVALVTGAAHRIGAEIVRQLHRAGMDILLHYHSSSADAEKLQFELTSLRKNSVRLVQANLLDMAALEILVQQATDWRGRLDLLVNNASSFYPTPLANADEAEWDALMGTNLKAPFFLSKYAAPLLQANRGCIVNLLDIHADRPLAKHSIYSIAKAGNSMLVKSLARELGPEVRVNGVAPGAILWPNDKMPMETKAEIISRTALKRAGSPGDIARAVLFLVQDAGYISGQIITVDGGRSVQQ